MKKGIQRNKKLDWSRVKGCITTAKKKLLQMLSLSQQNKKKAESDDGASHFEALNVSPMYLECTLQQLEYISTDKEVTDTAVKIFAVRWRTLDTELSRKGV